MKAYGLLVCIPVLALALPACSESNFVQSECDVTDRYAEIWLVDKSSSDPNPPRRSFSFQPNAVAMRVQPMYYAVHWKDIKKILFQRGPGESHGLMTIEVREGSGSYIEEVGKVDARCVVEVARFLRENDIPMVITEMPPQVVGTTP